MTYWLAVLGTWILADGVSSLYTYTNGEKAKGQSWRQMIRRGVIRQQVEDVLDNHYPAYERQEGICPKCAKHFEFSQMQADHITPWSKGGKTTPENCQMLCQDCNRRKSDV